MPDPFTIRIYVPDGDPDGVRVIDRMNWTGRGIAFPRDLWSRASERPELTRPGVYILVGRSDDETQAELPLVYIGQSDDVSSRISLHLREKDFWDRAVVFVSTNAGLNRAHITWLEFALVRRARDIGQCKLENRSFPTEPSLPEFERSDTEGFLREMLLILPVIGITAFEKPRRVRTLPVRANPEAIEDDAPITDTLIVPANRDGFERVFLTERQWFAVRIAAGRIPSIRYIAAYQTQPISAVTHWAPVQSVEPYGDTGKYRLYFADAARPLERAIPFGNAPQGTMQGPRYANFEALKRANDLGQLLGGAGQ
jgi:hypothetical protein